MATNRRVHPYKLTLWISLASILMMFAGFTSAFIVKRNQPNWQGFELPNIFTYSTVVIVLSSVTLWLAQRQFKNGSRSVYQLLMALTIVLGGVFMAMQWVGFTQLHNSGIKLIGQGSNVSGSFLAVIAGIHLVHALGGVIALMIIAVLSFNTRNRDNSSLALDIAGQYWHFVGALWIYLFLFLTLAG